MKLSWNYRVIKENKSVNEKIGYYDNYRVVEVFYDENGKINGWSDCTDNILSWNNYEDLKGTSEMVLEAFKKPVLTVKDNDLIDEN
jgi:hypothetical protein